MHEHVKPRLSWRPHAIVLAVASLVVLLSFLLQVRPDGRVHFRFAPENPLPHLCASRMLFDAECAGCGLTRSFIHLAEGEWLKSWNIHRAGWLIALLVAVQVPYRTLQLIRIRRGQDPWTFRYWLAVPGVAVGAILLHWGLRLAGL